MEELLIFLFFVIVALIEVVYILRGGSQDFSNENWEEQEAEYIRERMLTMGLEECKEVYFDKYCSKCENKDLKESKDPCHECLSNPVNLYSHKPIHFKTPSGDDYTWPDDVK